MKINKEVDGTVILTVESEEVPGLRAALGSSAKTGTVYDWSRLTPGGVAKTAYELLKEKK